MKAGSTALSRIVVARFGPGEDFFQSLIALCEKMEVESGAITSMKTFQWGHLWLLWDK